MFNLSIFNKDHYFFFKNISTMYLKVAILIEVHINAITEIFKKSNYINFFK